MATTEESPATRIAREHQKRHAHRSKEENQHCPNCGAFVSKPEAEGHEVRYTCEACNRAVLEYLG